MVALYKSAQLIDEIDQNKLVEGLGESQQKIVRLIEKNSAITLKEMANQIGISTTAIDKNIVKLKEKRIIRRVGGYKYNR